MIEASMRARIRNDMREVRGNYSTIYLLYPTESDCPECAYDEMSDSGYDITCEACGGTGYLLSWATWQVFGRVKYTDPVQFMQPGTIPFWIEIGDAELFVSETTSDMLDQILEEARAYVYIEGTSYRPTTVAADGVGKQDEWRVELKRHSPEIRATGY